MTTQACSEGMANALRAALKTCSHEPMPFDQMQQALAAYDAELASQQPADAGGESSPSTDARANGGGAAEDIDALGQPADATLNSILAGLRLLQHFNSGACIVTNGSGRVDAGANGDIEAVRDDYPTSLTNEHIDLLCDLIVAGGIRVVSWEAGA